MKKWFYVDHSLKGEYLYCGKILKTGVLVFSCEAESIKEADKKYEEFTKKDVTKQPNIGCWCE